MKPQLRINSFVGFGLMISLLVFAPEPSLAACRNSGGSSGSNSVGSQVNGSSVTICASALAVVPARTSVVKSKVVVKAKPAPAPAPAKSPAVFRRTQAPLKPKVVSIVSKPKSTGVQVPAVKPKAPTTTKIVNSVVTAPGSTSKSSATADFSPAAVAANVYPSDQLAVGQTASFSSSALQHFKSGTLLNLPTEVRFTPISVDWDFDDQDVSAPGSGAYVNHVFSSAGLFQVQVMATYAVSYRLRGSLDWIAEPETISIVDELQIYVTGDGAEQTDVSPITAPERRVRLVSGDCLKRPGSFGCD
jgi:hypothetical protein